MPGALPADKNHPGGLTDPEDESDGKIFAVDGSPRCPVQTVKAHVSHLNPVLEVLFQKPRYHCSSFNPDKEPVSYCNSPVGQSTLENMLKEMSKRAGIVPHLTNHCPRATSITVLSDADCESRHIRFVTWHKSDETIKSYNYRPSFRKQRRMSNMLSGFLASDGQEDGNTDVNAMQIVGPAQKENVSVSSATSTLHSQQIQAPASVLVQHNQLSVANNGQTAVSSTSSEKPFTFSYPSPAFNFYNCTNVQVHQAWTERLCFLSLKISVVRSVKEFAIVN